MQKLWIINTVEIKVFAQVFICNELVEIFFCNREKCKSTFIHTLKNRLVRV